MEVFGLLVSERLTLSLVLLNQEMLAGGLAMTSHSIVTVSSSLGLSLSSLIDKLVRGTVHKLARNKMHMHDVQLNAFHGDWQILLFPTH